MPQKTIFFSLLMRRTFTAISAFSLLIVYIAYKALKKHSKKPTIKQGIIGLIGDTPLIEIESLSKATGCTILGKAEFMSVGSSSKDRVALSIIKHAEESGQLAPGDTIFEGTVGSTGISLALVASAKGYACHIVMPDDQAKEKYAILQALGATVEKVKPCSIIDKNHFVNVAKKRAVESGGFFCDQFESEANFKGLVSVLTSALYYDWS